MIHANPLKHIAIIMDGNGRWAQSQGLSRFEGHIKGSQTVEFIIEECLDLNISYLSLFAFSTENWGRPTKEVDFLMTLLEDHLNTKAENLFKQNIKLETIGDLTRLPHSLQSKINEIKLKTKNNTKLTLIFALNYGGRNEIKNAALKLAADIEQNQISKFNFTTDDFAKYLETANWPDPDLVIRSSGEKRISNFMLWQTAYSEFYFTDKMWPELNKEDFKSAVEDYYNRKRRYGCIDEKTNGTQKTETEGVTHINDYRNKTTTL